MRRWHHTVLAALCGLVTVGLLTVGTARATAPDLDDPPRLVLDTIEGPVVIRLAPADAPAHVAALLATVAGGTADRWSVDRVSLGYYVQLGAAAATALTGLAPEEGRGIGNVRGAVSVYDGPDSTPTLLLVLTDSHHLDDRYTPVGWIESGLDVADRITARAADGDGVLDAPLTVGPLRRASADAPLVGAPGDPAPAGGVPTASVVLMLVTVIAVAAIALVHPRLGRATTTTALLASALVGFFAVWTATIGRTTGEPAVALVLFVTVIALFRLMGRFEQPRQRTQGARRSIVQPPSPERR
jgi:cyclophilin family peptidyl-prolyl cis-trans isomerase